jgi:GWxTD domain-containing protein
VVASAQVPVRCFLGSLLVYRLALPTTAYAGSSKQPNESELIRQLPEEDRKWLAVFVAPIILPKERTAFLELTEARERELFKEEFWKRRERDNLQPPLGRGYRDWYAELRALSETQYDHWPNDAARMVIGHGEPASINRLEMCRRTFRDLEIWTYNSQRSSGGKARLYMFYRRSPAEPRRMWTLGTADADVFSPRSCRTSFADLIHECAPPKHGQNASDRCGTTGSVCKDVCAVLTVWLEISSRQGTPNGGAQESARLMAAPEISLEGLDTIKLRSASYSDPLAKKIPVESLEVSKADGSPSSPEGAEVKRELTRDEINDRIERLDRKYKDWLDLAGPLLTQHELSDFLQLPSSGKDRFITEFWKRHS